MRNIKQSRRMVAKTRRRIWRLLRRISPVFVTPDGDNREALRLVEELAYAPYIAQVHTASAAFILSMELRDRIAKHNYAVIRWQDRAWERHRVVVRYVH